LDRNNHLFVLARQAKRQSSAVAAIAVAVVLLVLGVAGQALARAAVRSSSPGSLRDSIAENIVGFLPIHLGLWVWLRLWNKRSFRSLGFENLGASRKILRGAFTAALMIAITAGLAMLPGASFTPGTQSSGLAGFGVGLVTLLSYAVQSSA